MARAATALQMPPVKYSLTRLGGGVTPTGVSYPGGLDLTTPSLALQPGALRDVVNFEVSQSGGYARIQGYERLDGRPAPSNATYQIIQVSSFVSVPAVGAQISQANTGATGTVAAVNNALGACYMIVTSVTGTFNTTDIILAVNNELVVTAANSPFIVEASTKSASWSFAPTLIDPKWTALWDEAIFAVPLWEGSGQTVTDLVTGATFTNSGTAATWPADTYGAALQGSGIYGSGTGFTVTGTQPDNPGHTTGSYTYIYYGRFNAPGASNYLVAANAYNDAVVAAGSYGLAVAGSGLGFTTNGLVPGQGGGSMAIDTGFVAGDGALRLYAVEYDTATSIASVYVDGALQGAYPFTPLAGDGPNPKLDFCWGNIESGYLVVANGILGAAFHAMLGLDPFGPFRQAGSVHGPISIPYETAIGTAIVPSVSLTSQQSAQYLAAAADIYRAQIGPVPGSGAVLGVVGMIFNNTDNIYAFRANTAGTAVNLYKATPSGWVQVPFFNTVNFTGGGTAIPLDGDTLTQGGVTAPIMRVMWQSGSFTGGTAVGTFVVQTPASGNFTAGSATTTSGATVTLTGEPTPIVLLPGGRFEFVKCNFSGQLITRRIYGCDGVNKCFEFDGVTLAPITTGLSPDMPSHITFHKNFLFISQGASILYCGAGTPFKWGAVDGGGEIATGDTVTDFLTLPGSQTTATLAVYLKTNVSFLYGTDPTTFNYVTFNTGLGALPYSAQNLFDTFIFDNLGVVSLRTTLNWGNFLPSSLTKNILPFIIQERTKIVESSVMRDKSQYRVFFSDGYGLWVTMINGQYLGASVVLFPNPVSCADEGDLVDGTEVTYFGSSDGLGYVYQMDTGTSFDGSDIDAHITLAWDAIKSPRMLKRFRAASIEMQSTSFAQIQFGYLLGYGTPNIGQPNYVPYSTNFSGTPIWDQFTWDEFTWDGITLSPTDVDVTGTAENIQVVISSSTDYIAAYNVNSVIHHFTERRGIRV